MKNYKLIWTKRSLKDLSKFKGDLRERIRGKMRQIVDYYNGRSQDLPDVKKLVGEYDGLFRLRVGKYRVVFDVRDDLRAIIVIRVLPRKNAYG